MLKVIEGILKNRRNRWKYHDAEYETWARPKADPHPGVDPIMLTIYDGVVEHGTISVPPGVVRGYCPECGNLSVVFERKG